MGGGVQPQTDTYTMGAAFLCLLMMYSRGQRHVHNPHVSRKYLCYVL